MIGRPVGRPAQGGATAYRPRVMDRELDEFLSALAAIAIGGAKGVGKTATASRQARTVLALDDPAIREVVAAAPAQAISGRPPVLLDEWQLVPSVWDAVRRAVDQRAAPGQFLLTGSAAPVRQPAHSGAGRTVSLRMRPMTLAERGTAEPSVSLAALLAGQTDVGGTTSVDLASYVDEILASGLPGIRASSSDRARRLQLDGYLQRIFERDLPGQGVTLRRPDSLRAWLLAYAGAESTTATWEAIRSRATPGDADPPTKVTTIQYRDWLTALWLLDPVPGWTPMGVALGALSSGPKHHLVDPALSARLLGATRSGLLSGIASPYAGAQRSLLGRLFESLATLSVRVFAHAADATVSHLRTHGGAREVDLIVEGQDDRLLAIEVKLAGAVTDADVTHLQWLRRALGAHRVTGLVVHTGPTAYRRPDGIAVVPLALLGP